MYNILFKEDKYCRIFNLNSQTPDSDFYLQARYKKVEQRKSVHKNFCLEEKKHSPDWVFSVFLGELVIGVLVHCR